MAKSLEEVQLESSFQVVRSTLLDNEYAERMEKPLGYWALPDDRRLPLAFLDRPIRTLLDTPFSELTATPGIGLKKMASMVKLLHRAARQDAPETPFGQPPVELEPQAPPPVSQNGQFNPNSVSELMWASWRETVCKHNLQYERLGRVAPSLRDLPTVIWRKTLGFYIERSIGEIRELKAHGDKRVRAILEIFHYVHEAVSGLQPSQYLAVRLAPNFVISLERWVNEQLDREESPSEQEVIQNLEQPLLSQVESDTSPIVAKLAKERLAEEQDGQSVRRLADEIGVTRARVYQLLEECGKVMEVRWPEGECLLKKLVDKMRHDRAEGVTREKTQRLLSLFFPRRTAPTTTEI